MAEIHVQDFEKSVELFGPRINLLGHIAVDPISSRLFVFDETGSLESIRDGITVSNTTLFNTIQKCVDLPDQTIEVPFMPTAESARNSETRFRSNLARGLMGINNSTQVKINCRPFLTDQEDSPNNITLGSVVSDIQTVKSETANKHEAPMRFDNNELIQVIRSRVGVPMSAESIRAVLDPKGSMDNDDFTGKLLDLEHIKGIKKVKDATGKPFYIYVGAKIL